MTEKHRAEQPVSAGSNKATGGNRPDLDDKHPDRNRGGIPIDDPVGLARRRRVIEYLFRKAGVRVKPFCTQCGQPYLVERPRFEPDNSSYCPTCKPRPDHAPNAGAACDCGAPAVIIVYLTIRHPGNPETSPEPFALCYLCAIDELLGTFKKIR